MESALSPTEEIRLRDGSALAIRPIRSGDKRLLAEGFERLSPESRYRRFFAPLERLTSKDLAYLTEVDHHDHEAMIGLDPDSGHAVGVARYIRAAEPAEAEVAVVVADDWQQRGVATALLERLVARAREEGIARFLAIVLSDNEEAIELFSHLAPDGSTTRRSASGHIELVIELPQPGAVSESMLGRALRAAARGTRMNPWTLWRRSAGRLRP